jgi:hypothetical protein
MNKIKIWLVGAFKSSTIWFNSAIGMLIVALPDIQNSLPQLSQFIPINIYHYLSIAAIIGNIALRAKTNKSLTEKGSPDQVK